MKLTELTKVHTGKFLNSYVAKYLINTRDGKEVIKEYELVSRDANLDLNEKKDAGDAVGIIATDETDEKILLQKEFRLAINRWVYNFPGGMIDEGETAEVSAVRELKEETGLDLYEITGKLSASMVVAGFSDELIETVIGKARGTFDQSTSDMEEIEAAWYTKEQIRELIKAGELMTTRTQSYLYLWSL